MDFCKQLGEKTAKLDIIIDNEISLSVFNFFLDYIVLSALFVAPLCNELAVLHVGLCVWTTEFDAGELDHQTVSDVIGIFGFVGLRIRHDA